MSNYFQAVAINRSSCVLRNGVKIYDDIADCGHHHKTIAAAEQCLSKLVAKGSTTWGFGGEIRDGGGRPVIDDETISELYLRDLELTISDTSFVGSAVSETAYHVCDIWLGHKQPDSNDALYKRVQTAVVEYAKLR